MNRICSTFFSALILIVSGLTAYGQIGPSPGGGGGTPAGTSLQYQFKNVTVFGGANLWETNANTVERYNSTTAQVFNLYSTRTDASNYERLSFSAQAAAAYLIQSQAAGTGVPRGITFDSGAGILNFTSNTNMFFDVNGNIQFRFSGGNVMYFEASSGPVMNIKWNNDNTSDIGASGTARPRDLFLGRNFSAGGYHADTGYSFQTPATGFTITLGNTTWHTILDPAGTLATGTLTMPAAPVDGQVVNVRSSQIITSLTVAANSGQSIKGNPSSFAVGGILECMYHLSNTTWYC